jgi:uncharacterized protein YbjT (DUF2867 family)
MGSLAKFRADLSAPFHGIKDQVATLAARLRYHIRTIAGDARQWMAELRDQIRTTAGDSRQRMSDIREETAETLRNLVPRGRT